MRNASAACRAHDAAIEAAAERFRPILMTTLSALFGALPLLRDRLGPELRRPLGITIVGGLVLANPDALYDAGDLPSDEQIAAQEETRRERGRRP